MEKVLEKFSRFYEKRGVLGVLELLFHPFLTPLFLVPAWCNSLWNSRVLLYGQWSKYHGFHPRNTINCFFYKTQWLNLERYGRCGISPHIGLGNYSLSKWFQITLLSSCLYANAGAVVTLGGTLIWVFSHLVWLSAAPWQWVVIVTLFLFFSSTSYAMAFVRQNYNILGWMWLPIGFYAIATHQYALAAIMWLLVSFASITAVFTVSIMLFFMTFFERDLYIGMTMVPAIFKLCLHLLPLLRVGGMKKALIEIAKLIGLTRNGVKYKRESMKLSLSTVYFTCLYAFSCVLLWIGTGKFPLYLVVALLIYIINDIKFRFADLQSVIIFFSSIGILSLIQYHMNIFSFIGLLFLLNPHAVFLRIANLKEKNMYYYFKNFLPFDHSHLLCMLKEFFSSIEKNGRVLFAFENPNGCYERIFDGYGSILELPLFIASERVFFLFPSWYFIAETNYQHAPDCWGRTVGTVLNNMNKWQAQYVIIYTTNSGQPEENWYECFDIIAEFDWQEWEDIFSGSLPWDQERGAPKWWLLRRKYVFIK